MTGADVVLKVGSTLTLTSPYIFHTVPKTLGKANKEEAEFQIVGQAVPLLVPLVPLSAFLMTE